ncbi:hypothetical protein SAMN05444008_1173 [Cnuella takakiae]|uniref:Outer membrane protein beta-barrel domain-containing protein n=1 Tax=Cnuella takakiae TaxID=1302690 RepID=A0A1M5GPC3_9BACT|nr:hypothetical protein [Cnuella takakiae]OLY90938.1 hypothetical protein BUE76_02765 [Cnuella takakiae]SHG05584.1 hypothetical protein SAMN05444008_1173 [Cnuella takakiae]
MKKLAVIFSLLFLLQLGAEGQQNFFNVPSSDITQKGASFFQQQVNFYKGGVQFNATYNHGLGKGFEVGVNYLGLTMAATDHKLHMPFNDHELPYNPFLALNAQKRFSLSEHLTVAAGGQYGVTTTTVLRKGGYAYANMVLNEEAVGFKAVAGLYGATNSFFGAGSRLGGDVPIGIQAGMEQALVKDKVVLQADYISGRHNISEVVLGGACYLNSKWILSAGYQLPGRLSKSVHALVLELTYNPKTPGAHKRTG